MLIAAELIDACAPTVSPVLMQALVRTESGGRPFAIGMDHAHGAVRRPSTLAEAVSTAKALTAAGRKFSVGLAQIHVSNVALYGLTWEQAFDPCQNLATGQKILWNFYHRAAASGYSGVATLWAALRGYNSGGVGRAVSDDYANRIFAYMSSAPPQVQIGRNAAPEAGPAAEPASVQAARASTPRRGATPDGESPDIFAKASAAGF